MIDNSLAVTRANGPTTCCAIVPAKGHGPGAEERERKREKTESGWLAICTFFVRLLVRLDLSFSGFDTFYRFCVVGVLA